VRRKYNWDLLKRGAEAWHNIAFDGEFSVNVGDASGTLFKWESPGFSSHSTRMAGASLSKWPAATMLVGLVADGTLSFDDLASKHLSWWTTNSSDPRSRVKLRHLLSFTSGYYADSMASPLCSRVPPPLSIAARAHNSACPSLGPPCTPCALIPLSLSLSLFTAVGKPPSEQYMACAESMYKNNQNWGVEPGSTWSYLECHQLVERALHPA
jgi:hypothetical protein